MQLTWKSQGYRPVRRANITDQFEIDEKKPTCPVKPERQNTYPEWTTRLSGVKHQDTSQRH